MEDCAERNGSRKNRRTLLHYNIGGQLQLQLREGEGELPVLKCVNRLAPDGFKEGRCRSHRVIAALHIRDGFPLSFARSQTHVAIVCIVPPVLHR